MNTDSRVLFDTAYKKPYEKKRRKSTKQIPLFNGIPYQHFAIMNKATTLLDLFEKEV